MSVKILVGHCLDVLRTLPDESVHCCITSPPYWGLRDYGTHPQVWGGLSDCQHEWDEVNPQRSRKSTDIVDRGSKQARNYGANIDLIPTRQCQRCGAWLGELGLEPTVALYVDHLVSVCREVRRVLRSDGTLWLNLGDTYISKPGDRGKIGRFQGRANKERIAAKSSMSINNHNADYGLKNKDRAGIPWRVAFALRDDGWWLRQDIIYHKLNPMPESVKDRCTNSHEYVFLLSKSRKYHFDNEAIKENAVGYDGRKDTLMKGSKKYSKGVSPGQPGQTIATTPNERWQKRKYEDTIYGGNGTGLLDHSGYSNLDNPYVRNKRSVWSISAKPFAEAHYATFPPKLIEPMILAGTSARGCCAKCGAPWKRVVEPSKDRSEWRVPCKCNAGEPVPATVLDCFGGSGTSGLVADRLGRSAILIELNAEYAEMARKRISEESPLFTEVL